MSQDVKAHLAQLMLEKDELEDRIHNLYQDHKKLTGHSEPAKVPLIDEDGFPRADIDVYTVRQVRSQLAINQTDHLAVMRKIEAGLVDYHSKLTTSELESGRPTEEGPKRMSPSRKAEPEKVRPVAPELPSEHFTAIRNVLPGSPADKAGLQDGDKVLRFGSVTIDNASSEEDRNRALSLTVQSSVGDAITVWVKRNEKTVPHVLVPQKWEGAGVVGCLFI